MYSQLSSTVLFLLILILNVFTIKSEQNCDNLPADFKEDIAKYAPIVDRIISHYLNGPFKGETYKRIVDFVDEFGPRYPGYKSLEDSINYMVNASLKHSLDNVHTEEVNVTVWFRGEESATVLKPRLKKLNMLGLGDSINTPPGGITANAIVVQTFEELYSISDEQVRGKIIVYDQQFTNYGQAVQYRSRGAVEAAKKGAIAALVQTVAPFSISSPHTGGQIYDENVTKIPVASITLEDADYLWREHRRNKEIIISLNMNGSFAPVTTYNFVSELKGTSENDRIVVVSGHIDSWDVGDGAMDDAGGCFISWLAPVVLKQLGLTPKRTMRTVLFTAEELGLLGAAQYEERHRNESDKFSFVMESDAGTFAPLGLMYEGSDEGECMIREILKLFSSINATEISLERPGPDIGFWTAQGIPGGGLYNDNKRYFWFHHADGDTLNVLNSDEMDLNGAFWTAFSYIVADMKYEIPRKPINGTS